MKTLSEPPIWCDMVDRPLSVPIFLTPYMSAVRELVSGGVAIHDIPASTAKDHIAMDGGMVNPQSIIMNPGVTSIT